MPPGGPPDGAAPVLVALSPDSGAVNVRANSVLLRFDEVVNERSTPMGGAGAAAGLGAATGPPGLNALVQLSPSDGRERVIWRRHAIEIEPRGGFRPNTAYRVTLLPGLADLRGNRVRERQEFAFTTGAAFPTSEIHGVFFDWVGARAAPMARIELWRDDDSTFRWITRSDSTGRFRLGALEPGRYRLRGWLDSDNDRRVGVREIHEEATIDLTDRAEADLYAFEHDTIGPRIETVELVDSTAIRVRFDRAAAIDFVPDSTTITLFASDSTPVPLGPATAATTAPRDSVVAPARAQGDSVTPTPAPGARPAAGDTAATAGPTLARAIPVQTWVAPLRAPLPPGEYRVKAQGIRGLSGAVRPSERVFTKRPPAPPRDSTAVRPPAARPPSPPPPDPKR